MTYYVMDAKQLLQAMREIEDEGYGLAIYHSHSHTQAFENRSGFRGDPYTPGCPGHSRTHSDTHPHTLRGRIQGLSL
jgi:hypothetical protein